MSGAGGDARRQLTSLRTKLFYGFGSVAFGIKDNGFQTILLLFYNQVVGLPGHWVGGAIAIALFFDAFLDPVVGQFSDNLRTRWGRRHPLMYAAALPVAISYLLLWNPPHWSQGALFFYLLVVAIVVRTFITFYEIPSSALASELTADYDQRTSFLSYRTFFAWFGGMTMYSLAFVVFLTPDAAHKIGQLNETGYSHYGITAAVIMCAAILVSAIGTHKFIPYLPKPPAERMSVLENIRQMFATLTNRAFLILIVAGVLFNLATGLLFALNIYLLTYFWQLSSVQIFLLALSIFIAVVVAFAIALPLSRRYGKRNAAVVLFLVGTIISAVPIVSRLFGLFPPNGAPSLVWLLFGFATVSASLQIGSSILLVAMLADVVEDNERKTGRRSEGLIFAGNSFMVKTVTGLGVFASGLVLAAVHFPQNAVPGHVDPGVLRNLAIVYVLAISGIYLLATFVINFFPITRAVHEENLRELAAEAERGKAVL